MFRLLLSWFRKSAIVRAGVSSPAAQMREIVQPQNTGRSKPAIAIPGRLRHKRIYTFGVTQSGQHSTKCPLCFESNHHVFSVALDEVGEQHRCCLRCLRRFGGDEQVQLAAKRSRYARRVLACIEALDQLREEFPDPSRRPYGEKSLMAEIAFPYMGYEGIERVIAKIRTRSWNDYDIARMEGRPEPQRGNDE